jgi:hypothetical protein
MDECGEEPEMRLSGRASERRTKNKSSLEPIFISKMEGFARAERKPLTF